MKCQRIHDFLRCGYKHINVIKFVRPDFKVEDPTGNLMQNKSMKTLLMGCDLDPKPTQ